MVKVLKKLTPLRILGLFPLLGLAFALVGPLLDHHFAERDPFHGHLGLAFVQKHVESHLMRHNHQDQEGARHQTDQDASHGPIAVKDSNQGAYQTVASLSLLAGQTLPLPQMPEEAMVIMAKQADILRFVYLSPPKKPPELPS